MAGRVIWFTGIPGSGKTTIGTLLQKRMETAHQSVILLDGDKFRKEHGQDLGYDVNDRKENLRRAIVEAKIQSERGKMVVFTFTSPFEKIREDARRDMPTLLVYVKASVSTCEKRDPKGLYKQAREGTISNFVPFDIPFEEPKNPDIVLDTEKTTPSQCVDIIVSALKSLEYAGDGYLSYGDMYLTNIQRNRSLIKTTAAIMAVLCAVLSAYFIYSDIFLTMNVEKALALPKIFVALAMATGASVISYRIKTFTKRQTILKEKLEYTSTRQILYNRITLAASATFCIAGVLSLYYDMDVIPPIGEWNFTYSFYVGIGFLMGSIGTFIMFGVRKYRLLADKNS